MSWMNWSLALAFIAGLSVFANEWAVSEPDARANRGQLDQTGKIFLGFLWFALVPTSLFLFQQKLELPIIFGGERYDGGLVETLSALGLISAALLAAYIAVQNSHVRTRFFWLVMSLLLVVAFGEEASWGQHIFHWSSTGVFEDANLQGETNLHNFVSPRAYDIAYAVLGWALIAVAAAITTRPSWIGSALKLVPFQQPSPTGVALLVSSGILLQHEIFEEMAESVVVVTLLYVFVCFLVRNRLATGLSPLMPRGGLSIR